MKRASEITALELVALRHHVNATAGTPAHAKAVKLLEDAKELWRDKFKMAAKTKIALTREEIELLWKLLDATAIAQETPRQHFRWKRLRNKFAA